MDFDDDDFFENLDLAEGAADGGEEKDPQPGPSTSTTENHKKATFKDKTIENLLKKESGVAKISDPAVKCTGELMRIYALEILTRSAEQAMKEGATKVTTEHLEKVLAQFLLDLN